MKLPIVGVVAIFSLLGLRTALFADDSSDKRIQHALLDGDEQFWKAYNRCDLPTMAGFLTPDVEFYHDKGGITRGRDALIATIHQSICGSESRHIRREAVPGTVAVFLLRDGPRIYGAIETGEHLFYIEEGGRPEYADGKARFTTLWIETNGKFQISRELSYDHQPYVPERAPVKLTTDALHRFEGDFQAPHTGKFNVHVEGDHLILQAGPHAYTLEPESDSLFYVPNRDLTFEFGFTQGTVSTILVREHGSVVEKAIIAPRHETAP